MTLRPRLRVPLTSALAAALVSGILAVVPVAAVAADGKGDPQPSAAARTTASKGDGLTRSRVHFPRSSYLCYGYSACNKAGMSPAGYPSNRTKMYWRMYAGHNCTNYAAYRMVKSGLPNVRPWSGGGNATYWGTSVPKLTNGTPTVGAVAWWKANHGPAGSAGHVAYVERVISSTQIVVSQDSWGGDFSWATITKASGNWPSGFIHFNDPKLLNTAVPVISGVAKVGGRLTASAGSWKPAPTKVSYQWYANNVAISGAVASSLSLTAGLLSKTITVRTTATRVGYPARAAVSRATAAVLPGVLSSTSAPTIAGLVQVGHGLRVSTGGWNPAPASVSVQWYANGGAIPGATATTLFLTAERADQVITAVVTANRTGWKSVRANTGATQPVLPGRFSVTRAPSVSGTPQLWHRLSVDVGGYRPEGTASIQWLRNGRPVAGATAPTYAVTRADIGSRLAARVTVARTGYTDAVTATTPTPRVRVTPRIRLKGYRVKHGMRLLVRVLSPYVSPVEGTLVVRIKGVGVQRLTLRNGAALIRLRGTLPIGRHAAKFVYRGSTTVAPAVREHDVRIR